MADFKENGLQDLGFGLILLVFKVGIMVAVNKLFGNYLKDRKKFYIYQGDIS